MSEIPVEIKLPANLFQGKTAIVTGASRGVGRATALRLAESGANVVVNYLSAEDKANNVVALCEEIGVQAIAVQGDVHCGKTRTIWRIGRLNDSGALICWF
jgi:NAD(P)-dependent dehydrogenase (short-subunit alcohol dehydrogenase family)